MSAATAGSTPSGSGMAAASGTTVAVAIVPIPQYDRTGSPPPVARTVAPSGIRWRNEGESGQAHGRPARHDRHLPHGTSHDSATGWPTDSDRTPGPTASTTPAPSWPIAIGVGRGHSPSRTWRSEWHTPDARIRTRTSPARGSARRSVSIGHRCAGHAQDGGAGGGHVASLTRRRSAGRAGTYGT